MWWTWIRPRAPAASSKAPAACSPPLAACTPTPPNHPSRVHTATHHLPPVALTDEDDPRWVEYFKYAPDGSPRSDGLGRNVIHEGAGPDSPEAGRFLPMGAVFGDPGEKWHWAEGLYTTRHVQGVTVTRTFKRSRFMRIALIPRLSSRSEASLANRCPPSPK